jgi:hypothetical protein
VSDRIAEAGQIAPLVVLGLGMVGVGARVRRVDLAPPVRLQQRFEGAFDEARQRCVGLQRAHGGQHTGVHGRTDPLAMHATNVA